ncbi:MAG: hypothetical protein DHS20C06_08280 [Hyphobacterium sp.]|nr:MAG: hypothetical protein DHS20C06_08280 [Hyphobacterium sp.]
MVMVACNDAPFAIGIAVAYRNDPTPSRVARGWFQVPAGECLEGGLGEIVGNEIWIGAVSGEWRWPFGGQVDESFCTPPDTFFGVAQTGNCSDSERLVGFERTAISPFRSGWGRIDIRYACEDFSDGDAILCAQTATGPDGLAEPVRTLEICNTWFVEAEIAVGSSADFVGFEMTGWISIPPTLCQTVYRGFPAGGEVWFAARRSINHYFPHTDEGNICVAENDFAASGPAGSFINAGRCPASAPLQVPAQRVRFGRSISRFQDFVPRMDQ